MKPAVLNYLEAHIGKSFKKVKSYIYKNCPNGFYVYAKPTLTNNQDVLKYIGRYLGRPVIATSRIDNYDGKKKKDVSTPFKTHGERLFPCLFILTRSWIGAIMK